MGVKIFEINFSTSFDPYWFLFLYPEIKIHTKPGIISGEYILSTVPYNENFYPQCRSLFLRTSNGVHLEQPLGIFSFLKETGYFLGKESKLKKLKYHLPLDLQIPLSGLPFLFKKIQYLKLTNKFLRNDQLEESIFDFYKKPLHDRIRVSPKRVKFLLRNTIKFIHTFYLERETLRAAQVRGYNYFFNRFQIRDFQKNFVLTDSEYNDFLYLQTFFK